MTKCLQARWEGLDVLPMEKQRSWFCRERKARTDLSNGDGDESLGSFLLTASIFSGDWEAKSVVKIEQVT